VAVRSSSSTTTTRSPTTSSSTWASWGPSSTSCATTSPRSTSCSSAGPTGSSSRPGRARPTRRRVGRGDAALPGGGIPTLGVCLGHQSLAQAFGGKVVQGEPIHGKTATIDHDGRTIFSGLPNGLKVGRYHSLVVDPDLPAELEQTAFGGGVVMAIRHRELPVEGVQFHPESVLTDHGKDLLENFLSG
jgi:anthranilate synthase/aminodeoxychorismate synthase-like glutamine amidotransferase